MLDSVEIRAQLLLENFKIDNARKKLPNFFICCIDDTKDRQLYEKKF